MLHFIHFRPDEDSGSSGGGNGEEDDQSNDQDSSRSQADTETDSGDKAAADAALKKANAEAAKYRRELRETQKKLEELEGAQKSDVEKLTDSVSKLKGDLSTVTEREKMLRLRVLAPSVGIDPASSEDAAKLFDWDSVKDPDDDAELESALKEFVKARPHFLAKGSGADGGAGGKRQDDTSDMNTLLRQAAGRE